MALSSAAQADRVSLTDISAQLAALLNQGAVQMQYCGMTTAETSGDTDGIGELDDMCGAEFPGSRACTAEEISDTQYLGVLPDADFGWVRGEFTYTQNPGSAITPFLMVEGRTGYVTEATLSQVLNQNCNQFNSTSTQHFGLVFGRTSPSRSGQLSRTSCAGTFPVACCAPKRVTPVE